MKNLTFFQRLIGHFKTINKHKFLVMILCFKCGMYKQGLLHDLSKYSLSEFFPSVRYFEGTRSPITHEKELTGYSTCWLHHKGRNKHHWEYWTDRVKVEIISLEMPFNYMLESVLDKIAASKVYKRNEYDNTYPYSFFKSSYEIEVMNKNTSRQISLLLEYLKDNGEEQAIKYYRSLYKQWKNNKDFTI